MVVNVEGEKKLRSPCCNRGMGILARRICSLLPFKQWRPSKYSASLPRQNTFATEKLVVSSTCYMNLVRSCEGPPFGGDHSHDPHLCLRDAAGAIINGCSGWFVLERDVRI